MHYIRAVLINHHRNTFNFRAELIRKDHRGGYTVTGSRSYLEHTGELTTWYLRHWRRSDPTGLLREVEARRCIPSLSHVFDVIP
jgi:hypothetical protein